MWNFVRSLKFYYKKNLTSVRRCMLSKSIESYFSTLNWIAESEKIRYVYSREILLETGTIREVNSTESDSYFTARWKTRGRGPGVPRYGVPEGGKRGIWWKTRDLVENTGSGGKRGDPVENAGSNVENTGKHYFSPKYALSSLKCEGKILIAKLRWTSIQHLGPKRVSRLKKKQTNKSIISWERKPLKC